MRCFLLYAAGVAPTATRRAKAWRTARTVRPVCRVPRNRFRDPLTPGQPLGWRASTGRVDFPCEPPRSCPGSNEGSSVPPIPTDPFVGNMTCYAVDPDSRAPNDTNVLKGEASIERYLAEPMLLDVAKYNAFGFAAAARCREWRRHTRARRRERRVRRLRQHRDPQPFLRRRGRPDLGKPSGVHLRRPRALHAGLAERPATEDFDRVSLVRRVRGPVSPRSAR